jgi:hypothetical protein
MEKVYVWYMPLQTVRIVMGVNKTHEGAMKEIEKWWEHNLHSYRFSSMSPVVFKDFIEEFIIGE